MLIWIFLTLGNLELSASNLEIEEARSSILSLISPLLPGEKKKSAPVKSAFRVDQCAREKIDWGDVLLMKKSAAIEFKFQEGCDLEGSVTPRIMDPFPVEFKLRNLRLYERVKTEASVSPTFETNPLMTIDLKNGVLSGPRGKVLFEAEYRFVMDPMNQKNPVKKNLGGEVRIKEIFGKRTSVREKILIP